MGSSLGPVKAVYANANGERKAPIKARDDSQTGSLGEERNAEWRFSLPVPSGLRSKRPCAALQSLGGVYPACVLRLAQGLFDSQRILHK